MLKTVVICLVCLFFFISFGIGNNDNSCFSLRPTADRSMVSLRALAKQSGIKYASNNSRLPGLPSATTQRLTVDIGQWITLRAISNDGQNIDTFDFAQAIFDSSGFGLDADTCWTDSLIMEKIYDPYSGYFYMLDENSGFHYFPNHCFHFRAKGRGSVPQFTDSIRSPINDVHVIFPQPNDTIIRGESLAIKWIPQNEHNIYIQVADLANNYLVYYLLEDNGNFTIYANSLDSLVSGQLTFMIGRINFAISFPGFLFLALSGFVNVLPLELQDAPGIEETEGFARFEKVNNPFATTCICYNQSQPSTLHLEIYDITGKKIRDIKEQSHLKGTLSWDKKDENGKPVSKGIYIYKLKTADKDFYGKFVILR